MKCENCGSEKIQREITLITKMGLVPTFSENDPLGFPAELVEQHTAGWKGRLSCQECGAESEWYGDYIMLEQGVNIGDQVLDEAEMNLLEQAHDTMRMVVIPNEKDVPELQRCKACGKYPVVDLESSKKGRVFIRHCCVEGECTITVVRSMRQAVIGWNARNERLSDQIAEPGDE